MQVDIKLPAQSEEDPNLVKITGDANNVADCKEYLLNMEEEFVSLTRKITRACTNLLPVPTALTVVGDKYFDSHEFTV